MTAFCWLGRSALLRVSGKAYTSQFPFGEKVMFEHIAVLTAESEMVPWNLDLARLQLTDKCIIPTRNGFQKAKSLYRMTPKEKFLICEFETRQDQDSSGHRRMSLTIEIDRNRDEDRSNTWMQRPCRIEISHGCMSAVGTAGGSIAKMTVELQQPTLVMQQERAPSP